MYASSSALYMKIANTGLPGFNADSVGILTMQIGLNPKPNNPGLIALNLLEVLQRNNNVRGEWH